VSSAYSPKCLEVVFPEGHARDSAYTQTDGQLCGSPRVNSRVPEWGGSRKVGGRSSNLHTLSKNPHQSQEHKHTSLITKLGECSDVRLASA
jgi:hypothetical protein